MRCALRRNDAMKELVQQLQKLSYAILCDVDDYCRANNITY